MSDEGRLVGRSVTHFRISFYDFHSVSVSGPSLDRPQRLVTFETFGQSDEAK